MAKAMEDWDQNQLIEWVKSLKLSEKWKAEIVTQIEEYSFDGAMLNDCDVSDIEEGLGIKTLVAKALFKQVEQYKNGGVPQANPQQQVQPPQSQPQIKKKEIEQPLESSADKLSKWEKVKFVDNISTSGNNSNNNSNNNNNNSHKNNNNYNHNHNSSSTEGEETNNYINDESEGTQEEEKKRY